MTATKRSFAQKHWKSIAASGIATVLAVACGSKMAFGTKEISPEAEAAQIETSFRKVTDGPIECYLTREDGYNIVTLMDPKEKFRMSAIVRETPHPYPENVQGDYFRNVSRVRDDKRGEYKSENINLWALPQHRTCGLELGGKVADFPIVNIGTSHFNIS